jgi:hypothetical protein
MALYCGMLFFNGGFGVKKHLRANSFYNFFIAHTLHLITVKIYTCNHLLYLNAYVSANRTFQPHLTGLPNRNVQFLRSSW